MTTNDKEAAWKAQRLTAERGARSDSELLSRCITDINNVRPGALKRGWIVTQLILWKNLLRGESVSWQLRRNHHSLTFREMDVLATWLLNTAQKRRSRIPVAVRYARLGSSMALAAQSAGEIKPHELALSCMTYARALVLAYRLPGKVEGDLVPEIEAMVRTALSLEPQIYAEEDQPQGLRQLVRVLKNAGEITYRFFDRREGRGLLEKSLALAEGEADTESQAAQIRKILERC